MTIRDQLAFFCSGLKFEDIPTDIVELTRLFIMDHIGMTIAGAKRLPEKGFIDTTKYFKDLGERRSPASYARNVKCPALTQFTPTLQWDFLEGEVRNIGLLPHISLSL